MPEKPEGWDETPTEAEEGPTIDLLEPVDFTDELTEEEKIGLAIKWGKTYRPYEWV